MILLRRELGDVLREERQSQGRTLREVSSAASVAMGTASGSRPSAARWRSTRGTITTFW